MIDEAEQARIKAMEMESPNGAAAAVSAITAKLAGLWHEKVDQHNTRQRESTASIRRKQSRFGHLQTQLT
jgi:hypothetical protein